MSAFWKRSLPYWQHFAILTSDTAHLGTCYRNNSTEASGTYRPPYNRNLRWDWPDIHPEILVFIPCSLFSLIMRANRSENLHKERVEHHSRVDSEFLELTWGLKDQKKRNVLPTPLAPCPNQSLMFLEAAGSPGTHLQSLGVVCLCPAGPRSFAPQHVGAPKNSRIERAGQMAT